MSSSLTLLGSKSWMWMRGRLGELGRLSSRETGANLAPAPNLANTGEQGSEAESRRTSVPRVLARAWGTGAWPPR